MHRITQAALILVGTLALEAGIAPLAAAADKAPSTAELAKLVQKQNDYIEVQNLASRYIYYAWDYHYYAKDIEQIMALKTPGVSYKVPVGPEGAEAFVKEFDRRATQVPPPGQLHEMRLCTPVIEIAGDGKTAKGLWDSIGLDIGNGDAVGNWLSFKMGVDFVKEDGQWKIWHIHVFPIYYTPFDKSPTQNAKASTARAAGEGPPPPPPGDANANWGPKLPIWMYDGKSVPPKDYPKVPKPYYTFDPKDSY